MLGRTAGPGRDLRAGPGGSVSYRPLLVALRRFLRTSGEAHLDDPGVTSIGIGIELTSGRRTPQRCVQFTLVEKRADREDLGALGTTPVPPAMTIAGIGVPTDVVESRAPSRDDGGR